MAYFNEGFLDPQLIEDDVDDFGVVPDVVVLPPQAVDQADPRLGPASLADPEVGVLRHLRPTISQEDCAIVANFTSTVNSNDNILVNFWHN